MRETGYRYLPMASWRMAAVRSGGVEAHVSKDVRDLEKMGEIGGRPELRKLVVDDVGVWRFRRRGRTIQGSSRGGSCGAFSDLLISGAVAELRTARRG